jgi:hypothetical protein
LCGVLDEESTCDWGVCVEANLELAEKGEEIGLDVPGDGVVIALKYGGKDRACGGLDVIDLLDIWDLEVGETKLWRESVSRRP